MPLFFVTGSLPRNKGSLVGATASWRGWLYSQAITANFRVNAWGGWEKLAVTCRGVWDGNLMDIYKLKLYIMSKKKVKLSDSTFWLIIIMISCAALGIAIGIKIMIH